MAIKIIKKRNAGEVRAPAPLVETQPEPTPQKPSVSYADLPVASTQEEYEAARGTKRAPEPTVCSFCDHAYCFPCHGKNDRCMNAKWRREREAAA